MSNLLEKSLTLEQILSLFSSTAVTKKSLELNVALKVYLKMMKSHVRPDTLIYIEENLNLVFKFFFMKKIFETSQIDQKCIDDFIQFSLMNNNKPITINKRIGILKTMLSRLSELNLISLPEFKFKKLKETRAKIEPVKKEDIKKILLQIETMKVSHQLIIFLLISTGIRRNELVHIKVPNIDFKEKSIYLDYTKSGKPRYCYFNSKIEKLITKQIELNHTTDNPYLFALGDGHIDKQTVSSMLYKLKRDLNIDVLSSHKIRHYYATELLKNGADIYSVKELLGHSDLEMTQRYLDFTNEEIKRNNFKYNPLNHL